MINRVLHDSVEQLFVGIGAAGNLLRQILGGKIANPLFELIATLVPAGDQFVPGNGRLGPFLFGLPTGELMAVGGVAYPFIPKEQMLKQRRNGMSTGIGWRGGKFR